MKKLVAFTLVLVLTLSLFATAFAGYYPTAKFTAGSKKQYVKYGKSISWNIKYDDGSGPFYRVISTSGYYIWRANFDVRIKKSGYYSMINDVDFTGSGTFKSKIKTKQWSIIEKPAKKNKYYKYYVTVTSYYKITVGSTVYSYWYKNKTNTTHFFVYR